MKINTLEVDYVWINSSCREMIKLLQIILTRVRKKRTPQLFETFFLKKNKEMWKDAQEIISRAVTINMIKISCM